MEEVSVKFGFFTTSPVAVFDLTVRARELERERKHAFRANERARMFEKNRDREKRQEQESVQACILCSTAAADLIRMYDTTLAYM